MKGFKLIILDFDNTIVKLDVDWMALMDELKIDEPLNSYIDKLDSKKRDEVYKIIEKREMKGIDCCDPIEETTSLVKRLNGYKMAIFSLNSRRAIETCLERLGLSKKFDIIVSGEDVKKLKPDPDGILKILDATGIAKENSIFLGDSYVDLKAGRAAGITSVLSIEDLEKKLSDV
ncbi:MAG: fructose-1-P/6-phosphogluconate phosphatase [Candidatus Methanolliviera sp. GoM_asphalt]|nr:MAG: fructose-1-P/6-phosphogluconate phosphatase [Candidatus Methanolliviera sp. GoM_asphalt]